jgi:hypothetical protein
MDSGRLVARGSTLTGSGLFSFEPEFVVRMRANERYRFGF